MLFLAKFFASLGTLSTILFVAAFVVYMYQYLQVAKEIRAHEGSEAFKAILLYKQEAIVAQWVRPVGFSFIGMILFWLMAGIFYLFS